MNRECSRKKHQFKNFSTPVKVTILELTSFDRDLDTGRVVPDSLLDTSPGPLEEGRGSADGADVVAELEDQALGRMGGAIQQAVLHGPTMSHLNS